jgi:polyhydroxyalkanoate synthase subunit PhaC
MNPVEQLVAAPRAALEFTNILLTTPDAPVGRSPRDPVWTHRNTTLYRYRSSRRTHPIPILLVFALINRPEIFDLRRGNSFVEFLLNEGFDVFLVDWGVPDDEDSDMGLANFVCDELDWAVRETLRASGEDELTLLGWCIGGTLCAMYCALHGHESPVRNAVLLTTPIDPTGSLYARWLQDVDVDYVADAMPSLPGQGVDWANKMMKPVTNYWTTYRRLWQNVLEGKPARDSYQAMARWVADNPPFPAQAWREWTRWMYQENRLVRGAVELRGQRVDLGRIEQNLLVVTAGADHIAPRESTVPLLDLVGSRDVTHLAREGGHIGLMAGSKAKHEIWPELARWLEERSDH